MSAAPELPPSPTACVRSAPKRALGSTLRRPIRSGPGIGRASQGAVRAALAATVALLALACPKSALPHGLERSPADPGSLQQTAALPSARTPAFHARMAALWRGIVSDSLSAARPAFFPLGAYRQVKQIVDPSSDYRLRLLGNYRLDIHAVHELLGVTSSSATLLRVEIPKEWAWIPPGYCDNRIGYWHAPGARLVYRARGRVRSVGIFSFISWRGEWYVVHLAVYDTPGTVDAPAVGTGAYGPPGGC